MPAVSKEAYLKVAPHPEQLQTFHDKSVKRMLDFKDWPSEDVRAIVAPTLVMVGDADVVRPEHAVQMFRLLPHSQLAIFPSDHGTYLGEATGGQARSSQPPDMVSYAVQAFLDAPMPEPK